MPETQDLIIAGGGLAAGLLALVLSDRRPETRVTIIEARATLGEGRTWSFHGPDVDAGLLALLRPALRGSWSGQTVRFPGYDRAFSTPYHTVDPGRFHDLILSRIGAGNVRLGQRVTALSPSAVTLESGETLAGTCVLDARGWSAETARGLVLGYQTFFGQEFEFDRPHGLATPIIMDATIEQGGDYRFIYCLPYSETRMLIEDTHYSDSPTLDHATAARDIAAYAKARGWGAGKVVDQEDGCLPVVIAADHAPFANGTPEVAPIGVRAGLFHPTTSYSLPDAARVATALADLEDLTTAKAAERATALARDAWRRNAFYRRLNTMLFIAAQGDERRRVMERFYRLPQGLVERFYSGTTTAGDKARILVGRPPVPILRAARSLLPGAARAYARRGEGLKGQRS